MAVDIDLTDLSVERALKKASDALTANFERIVDRAGIQCRKHGGTEEEIESMRELQRHFLEQDREAHLSELRSWLLAGMN
jgi:hypothetical protein